jgi:hypothetical protein
LAGFLNGIFGSFFPGIWAASHQFNNFVNTVRHFLPPFLLRVAAAQFGSQFRQRSAVEIPSSASLLSIADRIDPEPSYRNNLKAFFLASPPERK